MNKWGASSGVDGMRVDGLEAALNVLSALGSSQGVSVGEISSLLGLDIDALQPILGILEQRRAIYRDVLDLYWLGPQIAFLGRQVSVRNALSQVSSEVLDRLVSDTEEDGAIVVRENLEVVVVARRDFVASSEPSSFRLIAPRGPLYQGGAAKLLLAYAPESIIDAVIHSHLDDFSPESIRSLDGVLSLLSEIRRDGYYLAIGEYSDEVFTLTAPIRDAKNNVVAAIGVRGRKALLSEVYIDRVKRCVLSAAERASSYLS